MNNEPAFPCKNERANQHGSFTDYYSGMTLRDWFAGQALAGLVSKDVNTSVTDKTFAAAAYECADAMMAERKKSRET